MKYLKLFLLLSVITSISYSQFDQPVLQFGIGIVQPFDDLKGNYYRYDYSYNNVVLLAPDTNLFANNFGAKTGLFFYGKGKINFDKYNILRAMASISFNTFNTFEPSKSGNIGVNINGTIYATPATYNYTFNVFTVGIGLEIAPFAFTNVFSPFFGANMTFNSLSAKLSRTEGFNDSVTFNASSFRIGFNLDCGLEAKFSKTIGAVIGIKYDLGNLLLKNVYSGISDRYQWGNTNASLNDDQGTYITDLQSSIDPPPYYGFVNSKRKTLDWGTIYLGINIYIPTGSSKTPQKK